MKTRIVSLLIPALLIIFPIVAQNNQKHEVSLLTAGGISSLTYSPSLGNSQNKFGGKLGIGYSYNINELWSLGTGLELARYTSKYNLNQYLDAYMTTDGIQDFLFTTNAQNYQERQTTTLLNLPIYGQINVPLVDNIQIYTSVGIKIGIPITSKYDISNVDLRNSGHYFEPENVIYDSQQFMGFGYFKYKQGKQKLDLRTSLIGSIEGGIKFKLTEKSALYTGLYFEHSLTSLDSNSQDNNLIEYNKEDPERFKLNGILSSKYLEEQQYNKFSKNTHIISFGLKLRYSFFL